MKRKKSQAQELVEQIRKPIPPIGKVEIPKTAYNRQKSRMEIYEQLR